MHTAASMKRVDLLKFLCERLHLACQEKCPQEGKAADSLWQEQMQATTKSSDMTVLHYAASKGSFECVDYLLTECKLKDILWMRNKQGQLPIHRAVLGGALVPVLNRLLQESASSEKIQTAMLYATDKSGNSLLHLALENRDVETVKYLLKLDSASASPQHGFQKMLNAEGLSPEQLAQQISFEIELE